MRRRVTPAYHGWLRVALVLALAALPAIDRPAAVVAFGQPGSDWPMFGQNFDNTASAPSTNIGIGNVDALKVKWSVTTNGDVSARAAVVAQVAYFPDWGGMLYAVNASTGELLWSKNIATDYLGRSPGSTVVSRTSPFVDASTGTLYMGTQAGAYLLAISTSDGTLKWAHQLDDHPRAIDTSSPIVYDGIVYVGVSSNEESAAVNPDYPCCSFRGSVVALNASTGQQIWKTYMVPEGYTGGSVWSSTVVPDPQLGVVFVTTGNNYSTPAAPDYTACVAGGGTQTSCLSPNDHFDSVLALKIGSANDGGGSVVWTQRLSNSDDFNVACLVAGVNCPPGNGPDYDFGSGANLITYQSAQGPVTILGAGQKSGVYSAFDPATGRLLWATQVGPGSAFGGMMWGSASDGLRIYVAIGNFAHTAYTLQPSRQRASAGSWSALDPATGRILWQTADPNGGVDLGPMTVANGVVYAPSMSASSSSTPNMFALNAWTGEVLWSFASGGSVIAGAAVANNMVYWGSGYSHLRSLGFVGNNEFFAFRLVQPVPVARTSLTTVNTVNPSLTSSMANGRTGDPPTGFLSYHDSHVRLFHIQLFSLTVSGIQATVYGTAQLADGSPVSIILDARADYPDPTVRLRLSTGYDSGAQPVTLVIITPPPYGAGGP